MSPSPRDEPGDGRPGADDVAASGGRKRIFPGKLSRTLRIAWPIVLILGVGALVVGASVMVQAYLSQPSPHQIALTGNVRTATTRVQELARSLQGLEDPTARAKAEVELREAMADLRVAHDRLLASGEERALPRAIGLEDEVERTDAVLRFSLSRLEEAAEPLERAGDGSLRGLDAAHIAAETEQYLLYLDHIDLLMAESVHGTLERLTWIEGSAIVVCGALLVLLSVALLRPSGRLIERQVDNLERHNQTLRLNRGLLAEAVVAAEKLASTRRDLLLALSHDVRGPLQTVTMSLEMARTDDEPRLRDRQLARAATAVTRIQEIVEEILARRDPTYAQRRSRTDLEDLASEVIEAHRPSARERGLTLELDVDEGMTPLLLDHRALMRVLENLLGNALKFTEEGGVVVRIRPASVDGVDLARIDVIDTGPGIPEEVLGSLFSAEQRHGDGRGHGLGLVITHRLVTEALGGEIEVDSEPGDGTRVSVFVPREAPEKYAAVGWHPNHLAERLRATGVFRDLVVAGAVDPEFEERIRELGAGFVRVPDGEDLSSILTGDDPPPDVLVFDLERVGVEQGLEACRLVRDRELETGMVGLYADASRADREAFLRVECDVLVGKPVDSTDLVEWLARAVVRTCRRELDGD